MEVKKRVATRVHRSGECFFIKAKLAAKRAEAIKMNRIELSRRKRVSDSEEEKRGENKEL